MKDEDLTEGEIEDREFEKEKEEGFYQSDAEPESQAESTRKSGLAYGAVITYSFWRSAGPSINFFNRRRGES
jgi:hypothetical protein